MDEETAIGGAASRFPETRHSIVAAVGSGDPAARERAFGALVESYWKPVYKYVRVEWRIANEEAKDLTQGFFAAALEKGFFDRYDAGRARFRTFLRTCLDGFVANQRKAAGRLKRGGGVEVLPLDFEGADGELREHPIPAGTDPEELFQREWARSLFGLAVEQLRGELDVAGKAGDFRLFERYDLEGVESGEKITYGDLAAEFGLTVTQVTNRLAAVRRRFRALVLERLRGLCTSDEEFRAEARDLLGFEP